MKSRLDQIETRLQALIERSASVFPWGAPPVPLARRLTETMQNNLQYSPDNISIAPDLYTILLNPENFLFWKDNQELLNSLALNLEESALELGIHFSSHPIIRVSSKAGLHPDEVEILVADSQNFPGHTSALDLAPETGSDPCPPNAFVIINGQETIPLKQPVVNIGRRSDNHLVIDDLRVSRNHAQLRGIHGHYVLFDLNTTGGTYVNNQRITQHTLRPGDVISLAGVSLVYGEDVPSQPDPSEDTTAQLGVAPETGE